MIIHRHSHIHDDNTNNFSEKMLITPEYIQALEEERKKIQVFQRELPLCLQLVTQAIEECKQRLLEKENECNFRGQSECSEQTSTEGPVLEQFIPLRKTSSSSDHHDDDDDHAEHQSQHSKKTKDILKDNKNSKKSDWLRSVQLWNPTPDPPHTQMESPKRVSVMEVRRDGCGGAFHPFKKLDTTVGPTQAVVTDKISSAPTAAASSTAETGGGGKSKKEEREGQSQRKNRRCWSPELHKRFLQALQQLGGSDVATPKQIRELMKVDGLTNDEVKSHLQKYRLHHRRPSSSIHNHHQQPQFVVVGGLWVPPPASMTTTSSGEEDPANAASNGIYTPIAALATPFQDASVSGKSRQQEQEPSGSAGHDNNRSGGGVDSHASADSSSSTDTATTSPNY